MELRLPNRSLSFPRRPLVMGIVNINDDSFSGDGSLDVDKSLALARYQVEQGADIIDVGAESARTNRAAIPPQEEIRRFRAFLDRWPEVIHTTCPRDESQVWPPVLSANTWRPLVAEAVLATGKVEILNDMGSLPDASNAALCALHHVALLIMHSVGEPKISHSHQQWLDVMSSMEAFFEEKSALAQSAGLASDAIVLDPGIDFAKQRTDNLIIFRSLARLQRFPHPLLVPVSRKSVIGAVLNLPSPCDRDAGTVACITASMCRHPALIFRVHNVPAAWQAVKTLHHGLIVNFGSQTNSPCKIFKNPANFAGF